MIFNVFSSCSPNGRSQQPQRNPGVRGSCPKAWCRSCNEVSMVPSRLPKRKFKLGVRRVAAKVLVHLAKPKWVPNEPSQQPQRKLPFKERFWPEAKAPRSTAMRRKWQKSWAFRGQSAGGEQVCSGQLRRKAPVERKISSRRHQPEVHSRPPKNGRIPALFRARHRWRESVTTKVCWRRERNCRRTLSA